VQAGGLSWKKRQFLKVRCRARRGGGGRGGGVR
jgi:hypothetical protein